MSELDQVLAKLGKEIENVEDDLKATEQRARFIKAQAIYSGKYEVVQLADIAAKTSSIPEYEPIPTGMPEIDDALKGFRAGDVIVLCGMTGSGKTQYGMQISDSMKKHEPLWLSYEMPPEQLVYQFRERSLEVPHLYTPKQNKHNDLDWVEERIVEGIVKYGSELVIIDNLDFIIPDDPHPEHRNIKKAVYRIKEIAMKWRIPIVLMAHMNRDGGDETKIPTRDQLKGSSAIEQVASSILIMWRQAYKDGKKLEKTNNALVKIAKNRFYGKEPNIKYQFLPAKFKYELYDWNDNAKKDEISDYLSFGESD